MTDGPATISFEEVYKAHSSRILNMIYRMTANEETARDLMQDVFVKVYRHLDDFDQRSALSTWIHRIAVNHTLNHLKHERRVRWLALFSAEHPGAETQLPPAPAVLEDTETTPPDQRLEQQERAEIVWKAIQSLAPKYRVPLVLYHYENVSYKEIAAMMRLSMAAVESRIHRAKHQLIQRLEPYIGQI